jgi:hypothetical protein
MDDGRNHRHVRASADPDSDAFGFDLDASGIAIARLGIATASPNIRLGLASRCLAHMANSHGLPRPVQTADRQASASATGALAGAR